MNILFLYDSPLLPESGGTERATQLVINELSRRGHKSMGLLHSNRENPNQYYFNNVPVKSLYSFLKENQIDIVINQIAFHHWLIESFMSNGGREWKKQGGKLISFMHLDPTPGPQKHIKSYFEDWKEKSIIGKIKRCLFIAYLPIFRLKLSKEYRRSLRYVYLQSDRYILLSKSFADGFRKLIGSDKTDKLAFISNMLTFPDIATLDILENKKNIVLVVARLDDEQKNISYILDVWKSLGNHNDFKLHIIGEGKDGAKLRKKARNIPDVFFEGACSPLEWYQRSKIFLMASPREGWGLTLTESLQNGVVPIVLNTSSVFKDIISDGENGILANGTNAFRRSLERLMSDSTLLKEMSKKSLESANRFLPAKVGDDWEHLIHEIYAN